jgi:hypothetical protein
MKILLKTAALVLALGACCAAASAQNPKIQIESLGHLEDKASKVVDVSLDEKLMAMAAKLIVKYAKDDDEAKEAAAIIAGIKEVYVRSYEFDTEGQYSPADVENIRAQVKGPGWSRLVGVRSKREGENAEVYLCMPGDKVLGVTIIAANPKELTVVNIVGTVDVERLSELDTHMGIPRIEIKREPKPSGN